MEDVGHLVMRYLGRGKEDFEENDECEGSRMAGCGGP